MWGLSWGRLLYWSSRVSIASGENTGLRGGFASIFPWYYAAIHLSGSYLSGREVEEVSLVHSTNIVTQVPSTAS